MNADERLEQAIGDWLLRKESEPDLLPGEFARELDEPLRSVFLRELEAIAAIDALATAAPARDLPRRFGDFRVLGELGRGAMGTVYDAEQVSTGKRVALKVLHPHVAGDLSSASRFQREARTAANLQHPGIVPVLGFGQTDGAAWLAMARIDGRSLQRLLAARGDLRDVDHARSQVLFGDHRRLALAIAEAADALEFAHRHNVVHRDVKPANLMVADDGRVVVLDFGLATAREPDAPTLTRTGDFLGTPLYMAPEQAVGAQNGTPASDVYALGAVLYECLCGAPPVASGPLATVLDAILNRDPVAPRRRRPEVPEELSRIAMQCLEKEPDRRYASAGALADDLRRFVDGSGVHARSSGVLGRSLRRLRRRPLLASLAAAVAVLVPAVLTVTWWAAASERRAEKLQRTSDLLRLQDLLGSAPERLTAFGGASLRYWARLGLGEQVVDASARSPEADEALRLAEGLAARWPGEIEVLRARAQARLDVGDDAAATASAIRALLAHAGATAGDRMMAAVWRRQQGEVREANAEVAALAQQADRDADATYWLAFWYQDEQHHLAAIRAFDQALRDPRLDSERRYLALLHRGWCRTCPDVADLRGAQDDLVQAAALRPRYGTPWMLWAALRCLEARTAGDLGDPVGKLQEVLAAAPTWAHVLAARVLFALAEGGVVQSGPVSFGAEFSPIAAMPVRPEFASAFVGLGLDLLEGVLSRDGTDFEAGFHRVTGMALSGRHAEALAAAAALQARHPGRAAVLELQRARTHLAAGQTQHARAAVDRALALDPGLVAGWRFAADLAAHVGDGERRLEALEHAIRHLVAARAECSVFPDAAVLLPELQLQRARTLEQLGRRSDAIETLRNGDFGGALAGEHSPRIVAQRRQLLAALGADARFAALGDTLEATPLRWLVGAAPGAILAADAGARMALRRGWLPDAVLSTLVPDPAVALQLQLHGVSAPEIATAPPAVLLRHVESLAQTSEGAAALLERADELLQRDPMHSEARLLRAMVLWLRQRSQQASEFLVSTLEQHADDLRSRYVLALLAHQSGDPALLQVAVRRGRLSLTAGELDFAARTLGLRAPVAGSALLAALR